MPHDWRLSFINLDDPLLEELKDEIIDLDIDTLTPVEALMKLNSIKRRLGGKSPCMHLMYEKSIVMSTFILCGFANFSSIGIQIGGIGILAPSQYKNLSRLLIFAKIFTLWPV